MDTQLKNALELIKNKLSKEDQVKALFTNDKGDVVLSDLNFTGLRVFLSGLKADKIYNSNQKAKEIYNSGQEAAYIHQYFQKETRFKN